MKEKPELLSFSTSVRRREQKASTSKTSSSCVHMRPGRAKYDAALSQCFYHVFAHIIKFLSCNRKCLKYLNCDVKMTSPRRAICMFLFLPSWIMASWAAKTSDKLRVAQLLSALQWQWLFLGLFITVFNRTAAWKSVRKLALQMLVLYILYFFIGINSFSNLFWEHLLLFL